MKDKKGCTGGRKKCITQNMPATTQGPKERKGKKNGLSCEAKKKGDPFRSCANACRKL